MSDIELDYGKSLEFFGEDELEEEKDMVKRLEKRIDEGSGGGNNLLGWVEVGID
ncbi:hypothetical protein [Staphylococcus saprophyticus]|uniref:hypothetical protein n=1 Tax=Staphylococcus saprophyticus TaxID=29385 RepID=UPI00164272B2|nr:hypothetical protein [Staphylococcus saprophyticus]